MDAGLFGGNQIKGGSRQRWYRDHDLLTLAGHAVEWLADYCVGLIEGVVRLRIGASDHFTVDRLETRSRISDVDSHGDALAQVPVDDETGSLLTGLIPRR